MVYDRVEAFIAFIELIKAVKEIGELPTRIDSLWVELRSHCRRKNSTFWKDGGKDRLRMALWFAEAAEISQNPQYKGILIKEKRTSKTLIKSRPRNVFVFCGSDERVNDAIACFNQSIVKDGMEIIIEGKVKKKTEHVEQRDFVNAARKIMINYGIPKTVLFAIPNGVVASKITGARLKAEGVVAGVPDLMFAQPMSPFGGLFIEMKREDGGSVSQKQKELHRDLSSRGYAVAICHGSKEALEAFSEYISSSIPTRKKLFPSGRWIKNKIPKV